MATTDIKATTEWQSVIDGPDDVNLQNVMVSARARYAVSDSLPTGPGALLTPGAMHPVPIPDGEHLYVKADNPGSSAVLVAVHVATDA